MKRLSPEVREYIKIDRREGASITDLAKKYKRGKTTIWHHVHDIALTPDKAQALRARKGASRKQSKAEWIRAEREAKDVMVGIALVDSWYVLFTALYWAEGTKSSFVFTNTDAEMIKLFLFFVRTFLKVEDERIDIMIRTSIPMKPEECRTYWTGVTNLPLRINHNDTHNKSKTTYGICRITIRRGGYLLKLFCCLKKEIVATMLK